MNSYFVKKQSMTNFDRFSTEELSKLSFDISSAEELAIQLSEKKLKKELNSSGTIIGKKVLKKQENDSKIIIEVFFKVKEDITDYLDLSKVDINLLNQEEKE